MPPPKQVKPKLNPYIFCGMQKNIPILQELSEIYRDHSGVHFGETRRKLLCSNKPLLTLTYLNLVEIHFSSSIETHQRLLFSKTAGPEGALFYVSMQFAKDIDTFCNAAQKV
jgi:hypothetical protein